MKPCFIVFEGIDGSGKSTQSAMLHEYFLTRGISCMKTMEPSGGTWGVKIREILKGDFSPGPGEMNRLFIMDREDDVKKNILPAMNMGKSIIMDRYYYSNAAYQGAMGLSPAEILSENRVLKFPEPDRVYFIDILPETAVDRIGKRNNQKREIFEKIDFLKKVREIYLEFNGTNFKIIDGSDTKEKVFTTIRNDIEPFLS